MTPLLLGILLAIPVAANDSQAAHALSEVHHIYVGSMGQDDEAKRRNCIARANLLGDGLGESLIL